MRGNVQNIGHDGEIIFLYDSAPNALKISQVFYSAEWSRQMAKMIGGPWSMVCPFPLHFTQTVWGQPPLHTAESSSDHCEKYPEIASGF